MEINKPVLLIIIVVVTLTILFLFVAPKYNEVMALGRELSQKEAEYENLMDYYSSLPAVLQELEQREESLRKIESALPSDFQISPTVNFLERKAKEVGLVVNSVNFSQQESNRQIVSENSNNEVKSIMFRVELSGNYNSLKKYLSELEKSARLFEVNSISFGSDNRLTTQSYNFVIEVMTYTYE